MKTNQAGDIVLVHGGFSDGSVWSKIISHLNKNSFSATAVQLPLTSLDDDASTVKRYLARQTKKVLLVGHSYGGAVITQAATPESNVAGCVYLAGTVPAKGEVYGAYMGGHPGKYQAALAPDAHGLVWATPDVIANGLAQDLASEDQQLLLAVQKPITAAVYGGVISNEGWRNRKVWYVVSEADLLFPPATQHALAKSMHAEILSLSSSHMSLLTKPKEIAELLMKAASSL